MAWPPERETELSICQSDGIFTTIFLRALLLGGRESLVARYQTLYDLTEQSTKKYVSLSIHGNEKAVAFSRS